MFQDIGCYMVLQAYSVLGVDPSCSNAELKRAYRQAVLRSQSEAPWNQ